MLRALLASALAVTSPAQIDSRTQRLPKANEQIAAIESGLELPRRMREHGIPGLSVAVVNKYKVVWAKGYGVTAKGGNIPVTPETLFMAGSISKPVAAVVALALVDRGVLQLGANVDDRLRDWKLPETDLTTQSKVTLGRILDHTSGITGGDFFPGYSKDASAPSLPQILRGEAPATTPAVRVTYVPGSRWEYSGSAYLVAQQLMEDASGESFPALARRLIFDRLRMTNSTFEQPLPKSFAARAAAGTLINGKAVDGGWRVQPEMAAGGLWTTPTDLARLAIELALAAHGRSHKVLSKQTARAMIEPHWRTGVINILGTGSSPDMMGYGFFVGRGHRFGHIGGNVGYQAILLMFGGTGQGAVIMTNSDIGLKAGNALLNRIADIYDWNNHAPPPPGG